MLQPLRIAFIGNALPRRCGIATFTTDLELAVSALPEVADTAIAAMCDPDGDYSYPPIVRITIAQNEPADYRKAADYINAAGFDVACLQHEFGIFGGVAGSHVLGLISALNVPLVTTLHTVLDSPDAAQRAVMDAILAASARVIVMARKGRDILIETYGADPERITVIPHGIPDVRFAPADAARERLGFAGRRVILTFGLISPNKGIEVMIEAMPAIIAAAPDAVYVVMGATHPQLVRTAGESYRESLIERVRKLGIEDHVVFLNRFVDRPELLEHIAMCDVYVTPYLVAAQMTSGTLAYSHGLGRPVVSTPYWHAAELLADGSGVLVPFGDPVSLGKAVTKLLSDEPLRAAMAQRAYAASRPSTWANTARRYADCFRSVSRRSGARAIAQLAAKPAQPLPVLPLPEPSTRHFMAMCDDTGLFQHAVHSIPDRDHGYCIDDNARALLLCCTPGSGLHNELADTLASRFAAFIQHGWNPDNRRFRNFMGFNRQWLEPAGSEDSHGRTLWALGACAQHRTNRTAAHWAAALFGEALQPVLTFTSPRAWAFTLLGLDRYCAGYPEDRAADAVRTELARRLEIRLLASESADWVWFEDRLTYDNARICEALIRTGLATNASHITDAGLRSLRWLLAVQTAPAGHFRPVGSQGFMLDRSPPLAFDQQPVEAAATISACIAAHASGAAGPWRAEARRAFDWFLGTNDLNVPLVDIATGSCRDGLHPDRANENRGAESVLSYLLGLAALRRFEIATDTNDGRLPTPRAIPAAVAA
ncbi:glycosyltransferase family 4 protein [Novosphingobium sp.]|uniref:glycosyltransferase family 4 protein n=1 Tax=Novosphingobium sp. TaxID=1874826 RepID=UPI002735002A|nr:glycosyltransferase family 4 protein [Novosphingobium sp.]MDP3906539.1 glycosyltransferase family 4 protein [Novosphingobium sp.]